MSSRLSRMTSVKSMTGRSFKSKTTKRESLGMEIGEKNNQAHVVVIGKEEQDDTDRKDFAEEDEKEDDVEDMQKQQPLYQSHLPTLKPPLK